MKENLNNKKNNVLRRTKDMMSEIWNAASFIIGTALSAYGIWQTNKGNKMQRASKTIDWDQIQVASKALSKSIKKKMIPDVIICPGQKGGIFAQLLMEDLAIEVPIYTGFLVNNTTNVDATLQTNYVSLDTTKWHVYLPKNIESLRDKNILIVDDYVMSGDFLSQLKKYLLDHGVDSSKLLSCSIATKDVAIGTNKAPNLFWKIADAGVCYFPWGKAH